MSPAEWFAHPLCHALTVALLHFLWQGLLVACSLAALVELLGIRRPTARYACSLAALVLMAACPLASVGWHARGQESGVRSQKSELALISADDSSITIHHSPLTTTLAAAQPYVLGAWLAGVACFGCRLLIGLVGLRQLRRDRLPLPPELAERVEQLGRRLQMRARSLVFVSRRVSEAMAVGLLRPLVLIPAAWVSEMPPAMLEAVIAHELAHLRRQDLWVNLLQRIAETLLFYHPAVWWLSRRLRAERELCCDELAVAATGQKLEYVVALEHVARRRGARVEPALAAGIRGEKNMRLLERVRNVLGLSARPERSLWPAGLLALALPLGVWMVATGLLPAAAAVVADDDRDDDDDDDDREEGRNRGERDDDDDEDGDDDGDDEDGDDDDDDDEKEGKKGEQDDDDAADDDEKKGKGDNDNDNDKDEKEVRKEGDREREDGERAQKEVRKEGDREREDGERKNVRRERDNPEAARLRRERGEEARFFNKEVEVRGERDRPGEEKPRDGQTRKEGPRDGDKNPEKDFEAYVDELLTIVKKLSIENERLRTELAEVRGDTVRDTKIRDTKIRDPKVFEGAAKEREGAVRKRELAAREKEADARERKIKQADGDLRREEVRRIERKEIEALDRDIKDAPKREEKRDDEKKDDEKRDDQ